MEIKPSKEIVICTEPSGEIASGLVTAAAGEKDKQPELGVVYAIGEGKLPIDIKKGDTVVFRRYTDNRIFIETEEYNFIRFEDLVGVVRKGE